MIPTIPNKNTNYCCCYDNDSNDDGDNDSNDDGNDDSNDDGDYEC